MSDDWDDLPRRRRYDGFGPRRTGPPQSGSVTAAGVYTIVLGGLSLLMCTCTGGFGSLMLLLGEAMRREGNLFPPSFFEARGAILLGIALALLLTGVGDLVAGIAVVKRAGWAWTLCIVMAAVSLFWCLVQGGLAGYALFAEDNAGEREENVVRITLLTVTGVIYFGHAVLVFAVLLREGNKAEFTEGELV